MTDRCQCSDNCDYLDAVQLKKERDEALANLECAKKEMMAALDRMNKERRWMETWKSIAYEFTKKSVDISEYAEPGVEVLKRYKLLEFHAKRIFEEGK